MINTLFKKIEILFFKLLESSVNTSYTIEQQTFYCISIMACMIILFLCGIA